MMLKTFTADFRVDMGGLAGGVLLRDAGLDISHTVITDFAKS